MADPITNIALGIAVNSIYEVSKYPFKKGVKKEIVKSFETALKKWSSNPMIRDKKKEYLESLIQEYTIDTELFNIEDLPSEAQDFFNLFSESITENQKAFNYLKDIKDENSLNKIKSELFELKEILTDTNTGIKGIQSDVDKLKKAFIDNSRLIEEWKKQLKNYEELIIDFKPETALRFVNLLDNQLKEEGIIDNKILNSKIEFLKGLCFEFDKDTLDESFLCFIKAYELNPNNKYYEEKASFCYYKINEVEKAKETTTKILKKNRFNYLANALIILLSSEPYDSAINLVPLNVRENFDFRRILYISLREEPDFQDVLKRLPTITLKNIELNLFELNYKNYRKNLYIVDQAMNKFFIEYSIEFIKNEDVNLELVKKYSLIVSSFVDFIKNTEVKLNTGVEFLNVYFKYFISRDKSYLKDLNIVFKKFKDPIREIYFFLLVNSLQQEDRDEEAIRLLDDYPYLSSNILKLMIFCGEKANKPQFVENTVIKQIEYTKSYSLPETIELLRSLRISLALNVLQNFEINFPQGTTFENDNFKEILEIFHSVFTDNDSKIQDEEINIIENNIGELDVSLKSCLLQIYFKRNSLDNCINVFESIDEQDLVPHDIYVYIKSLDKLKIKNKELLKWLELWRTNFEYEFNFTILELQKNELISNWEKCFEISEYGFSQEKNEYYLMYIFISAYNLNTRNKIKKYIAEASSFNFNNPAIARQIIRILLHFKFFKEGLELCYTWAKEKDDKQSRTLFFQANLGNKGLENFFVDYPIVKKGNYLIYTINNENKIQQKLINDDDFSLKLIGSKTGSKVKVPQVFGKKIDIINVIKICDKYVALYHEIMKETDNPHSGLGLQSFNIKDYENPLDAIISNFPVEENKVDRYEEYYAQKIFFSHLPWVITEMNQNYIHAYYKLINEKKGLLKIINKDLKGLNDIENYILDFTSIPFFFDLSEKNQINSSSNFYVSSQLTTLINLYKNDKFSYRQIGEEILNKDYYVRLLFWIEKYCTVISPTSLLNLVSDHDSKMEPMVQYLMHQVAMLEEVENSILITDDYTYHQVYKGGSKLISTKDSQSLLDFEQN